jgi:hypothetical protein
MNIRCSFCQTPYAIGRAEKIAALQHLYAENLTHYDAHCPRCRRATPVLREKLEATLPDWREALHELEEQAEAAPAAATPEPAEASQTESPSEPEHSKHHRARAGSKAKEAAKAAAAKAAAKPKKATASKKKSK